MAARDHVDIQREAEALFLESIRDVQRYLDIRQHPNERSKLVYDCIQHFNEKKENILLGDDLLEDLNLMRELIPDEKSLITVYDYVASAFLGPRRDKESLEKARKAWKKDFPCGHAKKETRSVLNDEEVARNPQMSEERKRHQCGLFAMIESIKSQFSDLEAPNITDLQEILDKPELKSLLAAPKEGGVSVDNDYTEDMVNAVLLNWGKAIDSDRNLRLGCIVDEGDPYFVDPKGAEDPSTRILWVHNSTVDSHWEGLEAKLEAKPETGSETQPATQPEAKPETGSEAKPETQPATQPEAKPEVNNEAEPEGEPAIRPEAKSKPNPATGAINSSIDLHTKLGWPPKIAGEEITFRKDPTCRFIFLEKVSSAADLININETMLLEILSYHQVSPCYLSLISSFRSQSLTEAADLFFGGFRSRKSFTSKTTPIDKLGRSGYQFHLAFKLKAVSKPSEEGTTKHKRAEKIREKEMPETAEISEVKRLPAAEPEEGPAKAELEEGLAKGDPEKGGPAKEVLAKGGPAKAELEEGLAKGDPEKGGPATGDSAKQGPVKGGSVKGGSVKGGSVKGGSVKGGSVKGGSVNGGSVEGGSGATKPKPEELAEPDWSVYEAAVYQCFDLRHGRVIWIITAPHRKVPESPSNPPDPWGNIVDVHKKWPKVSGNRPEDCLRASFSVLEWLGEWSLSEFGFYAALLDEKLRTLTQPYFISEAPEEVDEIQLKIMNNNMERLANCIVMLENNIKVFNAIKDFFTEELKSNSVSSDIKTLLNTCKQDVLQFDDHMTEIREVAEAIVHRATLLMDRALRREAGIQKLLQNRNDETIRTLTEQTQTDSTRMRIFAFITLILLPVTVVSTVFATDIVRFQEPTPIILNSTGATESSKPESSEIDTFRGKFSRWALMWWAIWCVITTGVVLIGSFWFQWRAGKENSSKRKPSTHRHKKDAPPFHKSVSELTASPGGTSTSLSQDDLGSLRHRPKRQGIDGAVGGNKDSEKATDQDMDPSTSDSNQTKIDSSVDANSSTNAVDSKTKVNEKNSKAGRDGQNWKSLIAGTQKPNLEHSTSESASFQAAPALEKGQEKAKDSTFFDKVRVYAGLDTKKCKD